MITAAAMSDREFVACPQAGRRLASVQDYGPGSGDRLNEFARQGRNSRHPATKIKSCAFSREDRARRPLYFNQRLLGLDFGAVGNVQAETHVTIKQEKH